MLRHCCRCSGRLLVVIVVICSYQTPIPVVDRDDLRPLNILMLESLSSWSRGGCFPLDPHHSYDDVNKLG